MGQARADGSNAGREQKVIGAGSPFVEPVSATKSPYPDANAKKQVQFNTQSEENERGARNSHHPRRISPEVDEYSREGNEESQRDHQGPSSVKRAAKRSEDDEGNIDARDVPSRIEPHSAAVLVRSKAQKDNEEALTASTPAALAKQLSQKVAAQNAKYIKDQAEEMRGPSGRRQADR